LRSKDLVAYKAQAHWPRSEGLGRGSRLAGEMSSY